MNPQTVIRDETDADADVIGEVTEAGLARLRAMGAAGCCLVGHPDYYPRFGFRNTPGFGVEGVPAEVFFALPFNGHIPQGQVTFHEAFGTGH